MQTSVPAVDEATAVISEEASRLRRLPPPDERRRLRREYGLSVSGLARAMRVTPQTVRNYESGARTPQGQLLELYVGLLDVMRDGPRMEAS